MTLEGIILVGGESRRFGSPKAKIVLEDETILERSIAIMSQVIGAQPIVVGGLAHPDTRPNVGPLGGLETAFSLSRADSLLVVACDMPGLSVALLQLLANHPSQSTVVLPRVRGRAHPLCARWQRGAAGAICDALDQGRHAVMELLSRLDVTYVEEAELRAHQIDAQHTLFNINRPDDLAHFLSIDSE
jgi:molybdopterin-guanine dinucleotide biosynthesis protein A